MINLFGYVCYSRSYHDGEHYNSVRLKDDPFDGPARSIVIKVLIGVLFPKSQINVKSSSYCLINSSLWKADADLSAPSHQTKVKANKSCGLAGRETFQPGSIKLVMAGTGCENTEKVEQVKKAHAFLCLYAYCLVWLIFLFQEISCSLLSFLEIYNLTYIMPSLSQILEQVNGDVDAAIEFLIAEQDTEECSTNSYSLPSQASTNGNV